MTTTITIPVTKAFKCGDFGDELLVLANGSAVVLNPGWLDQIFESEADARCYWLENGGEADDEAPGLLAAWSAGYPLGNDNSEVVERL